MPIQLTTPKVTGDLDPQAYGGQYTQAKIVQQVLNLREQTITLEIEYGNTVAGEWRPGILPRAIYQIRDVPGTIDSDGNPVAAQPHYTNLVTALPANTTTPIYGHAALALYQWLLDRGLFTGTIQ